MNGKDRNEEKGKLEPGEKLKIKEMGLKGNSLRETKENRKEKKEKKRKNTSPMEKEERKQRRLKGGKKEKAEEETETESEDSDWSNESDQEGEKTLIEEKEDSYDKEGNEEIEDAVEEMNVTEVKRILSRVMIDYRKQTHEMKKERENMMRINKVEWNENFKELKAYFEERDKGWRVEQEAKVNKISEETEELKEEINRLKAEKEQEKIRRKKTEEEVNDLKRWKKEVEEILNGRKKEETGRMEESEEESRERERERINRRNIEWITEEKEREKRKRNIIIVGLKEDKIYRKEDIEKWIKDNINTEAKIEKTWKVRTNTRTFMLGAQCDSEATKSEIMRNKKLLGQKNIYIEEDLTWAERKVREKVRDKAREIRKEGKEAVIIRQRKIRTEEGTWAWSEKKEKWFLNKESKLRRD